MTNIAIVDDEWIFAEELHRYLEEYAKLKDLQFNIVHYTNGEKFLFDYSSDLDIVFMDVDMPKINGFTVAQKLRERDENVILLFCTRFAKYAHKGYEVDAADYILKPVNFDALKIKMNRVMKRVAARAEQEVLLPTNNGMVRTALSGLLYVEVKGHNIVYHMDSGEMSFYGTLKEIEKILPDSSFYRCNNCYLVNLRNVVRIDGDVVCVGNEKLQISRPRKKQFMSALHDYILFRTRRGADR